MMDRRKSASIDGVPKIIFSIVLAATSLISYGLATNEVQRPPHIIFILADDLGWNDVGFHGSAEIPTPNIDALAYSGLILHDYYVNPICTPSRSALMTGKYPIHTGMQHRVLYGAEPRGLPLTEKILPEYLNQLGYSSHIAGKWHLGHFKRAYTPLFRGFKTHVGFWTGHHDYYDHTAVESGAFGLDMRKGLNVAHDLHGKYTTDVITEESVRVIQGHNASMPLFLYVAHAAVHSSNPYNPLPAPDSEVDKLKHITSFNRRKYAAMASKMDQSVGAIVQELHKQNMLKDSVIVFSTDNGGPSEGFNLNYASNWPLRGVKNTLWEGGVRGAALLWSPRIQKRQRVATQKMHIADWLPTLLGAAGYDLDMSSDNKKLDGLNLWNELSLDKTSPRTEILHNIDDTYGSASLVMGDWKVVIGSNYNGQWDGWYGPPGLRNKTDYNPHLVLASPAGKAILQLNMMPSVREMTSLREKASVNCTVTKKYLLKGSTTCYPMSSPCLFNVRDDPCEYFNLSDRCPDILKVLLSQLDSYNATAVPPGNKELDPQADPKFWDYTWTNFGDFSIETSF